MFGGTARLCCRRLINKHRHSSTISTKHFHLSVSLHHNITAENMASFDPTKDIYWFEDVGSTMDKARELLNKEEEFSHKKSFVVVADSQSAGRGTRGRNWVSVVGNLYMTLVLNVADIPLPLTLTPIRVGAFIIQAIDQALAHEDFAPIDTSSGSRSPHVQLKWPNDVIINDEKVSGVLIEIEGGKLLIGIGVNIANAPVSPMNGPDSGCRKATALSRHLSERTVADKEMTLQLRNYLATQIYDSARRWVSGQADDTVEAALDDFHVRMDDSWQILRRDHHVAQGFEYGDEVKALHLNSDGTLQVLHKRSNSEKTLTAEYLR